MPNRNLPALLPASPLHEKLVQSLAGQNFRAWLFVNGMGFQDRDNWWDSGLRPSRHEGLDLVYYQTETGRLGWLSPGHSIPAAYPGKVVKILDDFLGKSIFLAHEIFDTQGRQLYSVYGHTAPRAGLQERLEIEAGAALAQIAPAIPGQKVLPHLHLTLTLLPPSLSQDALNWQLLASDREVVLIDPALLFPEECRQYLPRLPENIRS